MTDWIIWGLLISFAGYWVRTWIICLSGYPQLKKLEPVPQRATFADDAEDARKHPVRLTMIVAAKNEAESIEETVRGLWKQTLGRIEWIVLNDRSEDDTGTILDRLLEEWQQRHPGDDRFSVRHIRELPEGWLGKNHALWVGAQAARGEWLLFTDADIRFHPDTAACAIFYAEQHQVDHLTLSPAFIARSAMLRGFVGLFLFSLNEILRPWRANDDRSRKYGLGVGAFNLVRRNVYEAVGTHRSLALRPDDDLMLGANIKQAGYRQRFMLGADWIAVEWYPSVREAVRGLEKNVFAGFGYNAWFAAGMISGFWMQYHLPYLVMFYLLFSGAGPWMSIAACLIVGFKMLLIAWASRRFTGRKPYEVMLLPVTSLLVTFTLANSVILALWRGGVNWRGTFYPLQELVKMKRGNPDDPR